MTWPEPVVHPVLFGDGGFCLLQPLQTYSATTASMLQAVQATVRRYADQLSPQADIVHYDCNPANVLATATGITGVIDWDGWCAGDRMFDVATMLVYSFGLDTLSWARKGAIVTGVDFSDRSIALAQSLSTELDIPATFVCSDIEHAPDALSGQFEIIISSYGVLPQLRDLRRWAEVIAHFLPPNGSFYLVDDHP